MSLFELNNVKMHYSTGQRVINALNGINVSFEKGVNIIYGKSGSGKSTLLHVMAGFEEPTDGKVLYEGNDIYKELDLRQEAPVHVAIDEYHPIEILKAYKPIL